LFRTSDAFAYLRNSNRVAIANVRFFFGNPDGIPLAGGFNGDGCDNPSGLPLAGGCAPAARTIRESLPEAVAFAVIDLITGPLLDNPRQTGAPLRDELEGSARRGTYRVLYRIDDDRREVIVLRIWHRRDIFRPDRYPSVPLVPFSGKGRRRIAHVTDTPDHRESSSGLPAYLVICSA